jgi:hypothetical protein
MLLFTVIANRNSGEAISMPVKAAKFTGMKGIKGIKTKIK